MTIDDATRRQITAADPTVSTWLAANAGSGKTRVLTDRVARLLLEKVPPQNILCLTYTKAAAGEMQNRLFRRLGKWAMMGNADLAKELANLGAPGTGDAPDLAFARTLFARAIDTPGGLRIQTIHSFCASLLRRFPLEAGVSPVFREMDDRAARLLREDITESMARGDDAGLIRDLASHYSGDDFGNLAAEAVRHRQHAESPRSDAEIWGQFGLPDGFDQTQLLAAAFSPDVVALFAALCPVLVASDKVTDQKAAARLMQIDFAAPNIADLLQLFSVLLYGATAKNSPPFSAKIDGFPTKDARAAITDIIGPLNEFMARIEAAREQYINLLAAQKTRAFLRFSNAFLPIYEARKAARGWLDFDDLITRARDLLSDPAVAQWVLFRLDGGLDHILVDEAQDTSPTQWKVIELLAQEFNAGIGARPDVSRTIFVVGDLKQSIYSFQGADPRAFEQMRQHFARDLANSNQKLFEQSLEHSFRSSPAILSVVDAVFQGSGAAGFGDAASHRAFYGDLPGRVDLWDIVEKFAPEPEKDWYDPTDKIAGNDHSVLLAEMIADQIDTLVKTGSVPGENGVFRQIECGDFLILVQRRSALFHQIIRACKTRGLAIAGADRLKIGAELAVRDLQALLAFLALPQDSLSLAAALRSPLFGISEAELFGLAHGRQEKDLWPALVRQQNKFELAFAILNDLRGQVDFLRPYELLERILIRHGGRNRLLARLGPEAEDGIDALLNQALAYEASQIPSLTGFLGWLAADGIEIKRQSDSAGGRIRVMTTHGAKGLESPIVILPDTGDRRPPEMNEIIKSGDGTLMWKTPAKLRPREMTAAIDQASQAWTEEAARLLYVALTRAEKWLIICASGEIKPEGNSWYRQVEAGMTAIGAQRFEEPVGQGLRVEHGRWRSARFSDETQQSDAVVALPEWAATHAAAPGITKAPLRPSDMAGDKSLPGELRGRSAAQAAIRGSQIHRLLEHLPNHRPADWPHVAQQVLADATHTPTHAAVSELVAEAAGVINSPGLAHLFGPDSLSEVAFKATLPGPESAPIHGTIDRLVVSPTQVLVVDFKSNQLVPDRASDTPPGILNQMAAYLAAMELIYPDRQIKLAIVWTRGAKLMSLPHDIVRAAAQNIQHLDVTPRRP